MGNVMLRTMVTEWPTVIQARAPHCIMKFIAPLTIMVVTGLTRGSPVPSGGSQTPYPYGLFWHHDYALPVPQARRNDDSPEEQTPPPMDRSEYSCVFITIK